MKPISAQQQILEIPTTRISRCALRTIRPVSRRLRTAAYAGSLRRGARQVRVREALQTILGQLRIRLHRFGFPRIIPIGHGIGKRAKEDSMLRTIVVTVAGLILSALLAAAATSFVLSHTQFGRLMTGNSSGMSDPWQVFMGGSKVLFFYVCLPTVIWSQFSLVCSLRRLPWLLP